MKFFLSLFLIAFCFLIPAAEAQQSYAPPAAAPVVLELFTSQNCPSCPPGDKNFTEAAAQPGTIAIACHITYFNTQQFQDVLSRDFCTQRQSFYNKAMGRGMRVYTPQLIINGNLQFNAADKSAVTKNLIEGRAQRIVNIPVTVDPEKGFQFHFPALPQATGTQYKVIVFGYRKHNFQALKGGANNGQSVFYTNAALSTAEAGTWNGQMQTTNFRPGDSDVNDGYAVLAQDPETGRIVAAGKIER